LKIRAEKAEAALKENKNNSNVYRNERMRQEKFLEAKLSRTLDDLTAIKTEKVKLATEDEHNTEKYKIVQTNVTKYKKDLASAQEKINALQSANENEADSLTQENASKVTTSKSSNDTSVTDSSSA